ncbi:MAG: hypothetical protein ACU0A6_01190 [Shimia sp.]|jgi:hypothetical protein|uniref:hypothetical protein n=1 Tax=Shimia sp. TaxID=1954381 RepID=UPI00405A363C
MFAYKSDQNLNDTLTSLLPLTPASDAFCGDGVALFSSGLEASGSDVFAGDGAAMFSSGLVQMFSSGLAPTTNSLRLVSGDGAEMFSSGL